MEPIDLSNLRGYSKEELFTLFREFLEEYYKQKEKELYEVSLIERIIRVEEELKNLRKEMEYLRKEMDYPFESLLREMNARFEALEKRFNFLQWTMMLGFTFLSILITIFSFLFRS
jgi:superfamily II RNA helicase